MSYLLCYALLICLLVLIREMGHRSTLDRFLVADRNVGGFIGSMSIAASWIWAPAIFISSQTGFKWGYAGLLWFCVPNMLALILFAPLATKVRRSLPQGYNYIEYLQKAHPSFRHIQLILQLVMQVVIFAIQLVAGAELLADLTGAPYGWMVIGMAITPFCYTFFSGLRTSVFTDAVQYIVIAAAAVSLVVAFPAATSVIDSHPFKPLNTSLLFEFGISSAVGLIVAIFADHQQWQRAFAIKEQKIIPTFYWAAALHGLVTVCLGVLGSLIYTQGFHPIRVDLVGFEYVKANYAPIFIPIFIIMAMCALISTLDSGLCAFSSLAMKQLSRERISLMQGRAWMMVLATVAAVVALQRPTLLTLWFIGCTIRLSSFFPTILSILRKSMPSEIYTIAILTGLIFGGSTFAYGVICENNYVRTIGMVMTLILPGAVLATEGHFNIKAAFSELIGLCRLIFF